MTQKLVFWTAFNSYQSSKLLRGAPEGTAHPVGTAAWTRRRAELFVRYSLPSILNQTWKDWLYVLLLDPKLRHLTDPILPKLEDPRIIYCYEDSPVLEKLREYDQAVLALIDSDDMYARDAGALMMTCSAEWMYFKKGYALEEGTGRLWQYDTIGTGPFWARRIDPRKLTAFDRDKRHPTHVAVRKFLPKQLRNGRFCVLIHGANTSSTADMRYVIKEPVDRAVLRIFGIQGRLPLNPGR